MEYAAGVEMGSFAASLVIIDNQKNVVWKDRQRHHGDSAVGVKILLDRAAAQFQEADFADIPAAVTGSCCNMEGRTGDIPAIHRGAELLYPRAGSVIEIGAQNAFFLTGLGKGAAPLYASNEGCAGGTGSFFEDQMYRLGLKLEDYSRLVDEAGTVPRLSGRCSVFAKTDIIHRQQEGVSTPDILLGLCYAAIRNYRAVMVRGLPVEKPLALCGGIIHNAGVVRAVAELFNLDKGELLTDAYGEYVQAAGAAGLAMESAGRKMKAGNSRRDMGRYTLESLRGEIGSLEGDMGSIKGYPVIYHSLACLPKLNLDRKAFGNEIIYNTPDPRICSLGIDVGSTSTNLVLSDRHGRIVDSQYLRTRGNPREAVSLGMKRIREKFGSKMIIESTGITGSGRYLIGKQLDASLIVDEITAQGKAAATVCPEVDTVFEIGGQDSKYIRIHKGEIQDFQMNKICAAGTGSFLEEQAGRMKIPLEEYGKLALEAEAPVDLGERCTVFIESRINTCLASGAAPADVLAGLCYSVINNYLHKVVGNKPVGSHVVLQGGVCYNPAVVAAFQAVYGSRITVSPCFAVSGAYGASRLAAEKLRKKDSVQADNCEGTAFYRKSKESFLDGYTRSDSEGRQVIGIPYVLLVHKFFPLFRKFFEGLGYQVLLSPETDEEIIALAQSHTQAETCYPVKLIYGHMAWLAKQKPGYIFLPSILTMKHENSKVRHNYGCVYMQTAPRLVFEGMGLGEKGIRLLNPVFNLDFGQQAMAGEMIGIGRKLGHSPETCKSALIQGSMAVRKHTGRLEALGRQLIASLKKDEKVLVMVTRTYGIEDPILNLGIPEELLKRGYQVITLSHLPVHDLDISEEYENMYWPFGQHILSGAKLIASHPNLYAVYLTNHGCGPDSMLSHLFRKEMGDKPYLNIEVDEHFSKVGVITRIEAFLNSLEMREDTEIRQSEPCFASIHGPAGGMLRNADKNRKIYLPYLDPYSRILAERLRTLGYDAESLPPTDAETLALGRGITRSTEYLAFVVLAGAVLKKAQQEKTTFQVVISQSEGSEADGVYARVLQEYLPGPSKATVISPMLETMPWEMEPELFGEVYDGILEGDYSLWAKSRMSQEHAGSRQVLLTGDPYLVYNPVLNGNLAKELEQNGLTALHMPLGEYLLCMWKQRAETEEQERVVDACVEKMEKAALAYGNECPYTTDINRLVKAGVQSVPVLTGANAVYRAGKRLDSTGCAGILELSSMYENVQTIIDLSAGKPDVPVLSLSFEGSNLEAVRDKVQSFLYYLG